MRDDCASEMLVLTAPWQFIACMHVSWEKNQVESTPKRSVFRRLGESTEYEVLAH